MKTLLAAMAAIPAKLAVFETLTPENTLLVSLNDERGCCQPTRTLVADHSAAIAYAIVCYAIAHGIDAATVQYAARHATAAEVGA